MRPIEYIKNRIYWRSTHGYLDHPRCRCSLDHSQQVGIAKTRHPDVNVQLM